ncbi:MAG: ribbon-helix-helix domain-containing protein [Actinomycetota bacterium]|nr:ribbon-helix-helix domain-containing protein [Actinomycetota bacterium]
MYLPDDVRAALGRLAAERGVSESSLVREAVAGAIRKTEVPKPRLPLFHSNDPTLAERIDEELAGFGES